jgi:hypothetical protein
MLRTDIINQLIKKFDYKSYLEIGTQNPHSNYNRINVAKKTCVEPFPIAGTEDKITFIGTSDEFFKSISDDIYFDIIFIDGLHHYDQVLIDIENSLQHLSENGTIVCHDCLPTTEHMQYRENLGGEWTGDVWKAIANLRVERIDLDIKVVNTDYGCGIIRRGTNIPYYDSDANYYTYTYYSTNSKRLLNVISIEDFLLWKNSL